MPDYKITYHTHADGIEAQTVSAASPEEAIKFLANNPLISFAQLKEIIMTTPTPQPDRITAGNP